MECFANGVRCAVNPGAVTTLKYLPNVRLAIERHALERSQQSQRPANHDKFVLIATPVQSLMAAAKRAREMGIEAYVLGDSIEGESKDVAKFHADIARAVLLGKSSMQRPCVILSGERNDGYGF